MNEAVLNTRSAAATREAARPSWLRRKITQPIRPGAADLVRIGCSSLARIRSLEIVVVRNGDISTENNGIKSPLTIA